MNMATLSIIQFGDVDSLGEFLFENGLQHQLFRDQQLGGVEEIFFFFFFFFFLAVEKKKKKKAMWPCGGNVEMP